MKYVYKGEIKPLPKKWVFTSGKKKGMSTGNFNQLPVAELVKEGFLPVTKEASAAYDPEIQERPEPVIKPFKGRAEVTYNIKDKPLDAVQNAKKVKVKREGKEIFKQKWDLEYRQMDMYTTEDAAQMDADKEAMLSYYKTTIKTLIENAATVQEVKNITYTWPAL